MQDEQGGKKKKRDEESAPVDGRSTEIFHSRGRPALFLRVQQRYVGRRWKGINGDKQKEEKKNRKEAKKLSDRRNGVT